MALLAERLVTSRVTEFAEEFEYFWQVRLESELAGNDKCKE
jgi:hypothetical protein